MNYFSVISHGTIAVIGGVLAYIILSKVFDFILDALERLEDEDI